jgi:hypothetical protein
LELETQGADKFFGEPALNLEDLIQTQSGRGVVNILAGRKIDATVAESVCDLSSLVTL